jgi:putative DNA primase/helicase
LGWDFFAAAAVIEDGKWSHRDALIKARVLVRRINNGTVKLKLPAPVTPSHSGSETQSAESGRQTLIEILKAFICGALDWFNRDPHADQHAVDQLLGGPHAPVWATQVSTGVGKTRLCAETIAADRIARHAAGEAGPLVVRSWLYLVPTHRLGDDIAEQFIGHGITARVFRGREAFDPTDPEPDPEKKRRMCLNLKQVRLALEAGAFVSTTCCSKRKGGSEQRCKFYDVCSYQQQIRGEKPDAWIAAHEILFHPQKAFGKIAGVIVDESFWQDGMRLSMRGLDLTEIATALIPPRGLEDLGAELDALRNKLVKALRAQPAVGGVKRDTLASLSANDCTRAIQLEWQLVEKLKIWPGMPMHAIERAATCIPSARRARRMVAIWGAARELIRRPDIAISGRLVIDENSKGERLIRHHGIAPIRKQWHAPTLIMDATLPGMPILQAYYPQVMLKAQIEAAMPHVRIRQILRAPVSAKRLIKTCSDINRKAIRRYVLERWLETGQHPTLVVCQKKVEEWLKGSGLPETIAVEHFNNISGIDHYKDVRLLILVGRTIPGPEAVETMAGALTGAEPSKTKKARNGICWYERVVRGVRLANGTGVAVECDQHLDPAAEAIRWQICEGELVQALGRGRGVNRMINTPLDIDIIADVCLAVTVDEVRHWAEPSEVVEMAVEGIGLTSPVDMVRAWPNIWANTRAADRTLQLLIRLCRDVPEAKGLTGAHVATKSFRIYYIRLCRDVRLVRYQLSGPRTNRRTAFVDLARLPDPRTWLERRLGPLAYFEIE